MAISVPVDLGFAASASTPTTLAITTTHAVAAADCVLVFHYANASNSTIVSITDSSSNTYVKVFNYTAVAPLFEVWACYNAASMASSSTITLNSFANSSLRHGMAAWTITGTANTTPTGSGSPTIPVDRHTLNNSIAQGTGVGSASIPVLNSYNNNQILIGCVVAGATLASFASNGSFTLLGGGTTNAAIFPSYQIVSAPTSVTYAPTWTASQLTTSSAFALFGPSTSGGGGVIG